MNVHGVAPGNSCVAGFQFDPSGGTNVTTAGRSSRCRAHISVAGRFMWAWVVSMPR